LETCCGFEYGSGLSECNTGFLLLLVTELRPQNGNLSITQASSQIYRFQKTRLNKLK